MTSDAIRNKIRQELQAAQTIARRAVDEQRGMTADDKAQLQRHKDTAALLERQLPGAESENLIAEIGRFSGAPEHQRQAPRGSDTRIPDGRGGEVIALSKAHRCVDFLRARGLMGHDEDIRAERVLPALLVPEARRFCNDVEQRALAATTVTGGGVLLASPIAATIIDLARAKSAIFSAGAVILPMTSGTLTVPKITGGAEPEWVDENQEPSESDIVFGDITLTTKNLACVVRVSEELVQDAPDQAGVVVTRELTAAMAATFDTACLTGTGLTNQPKGLQYWGINTVSMGANGGTPTDYSKLLDAIAAVRAQHGEPTAFIWNSRTARTFDGLVSSVDSQPLIPPPRWPTTRGSSATSCQTMRFRAARATRVRSTRACGRS